MNFRNDPSLYFFLKKTLVDMENTISGNKFGFLPGSSFRGKMYCYANFCIVFGQNFRVARSLEEGKLLQGGASLLPPPLRGRKPDMVAPM